MKLLKGIGILIGGCLLFDLVFIGAMQEEQMGVSTINDNLDFGVSLLILIVIGTFISKIFRKRVKKSYVYINGKRNESVEEMYARTYSKNKNAREEGMGALISTLQEMGNSRELTNNKLIEKYHISPKYAEQVMNNYWK